VCLGWIRAVSVRAVTLLRITELVDGSHKTLVVLAKAGTQRRSYKRRWIPAFAGMTMGVEIRDAAIVR
jgi:hypothetical protein